MAVLRERRRTHVSSGAAQFASWIVDRGSWIVESASWIVDRGECIVKLSLGPSCPTNSGAKFTPTDTDRHLRRPCARPHRGRSLRRVPKARIVVNSDRIRSPNTTEPREARGAVPRDGRGAHALRTSGNAGPRIHRLVGFAVLARSAGTPAPRHREPSSDQRGRPRHGIESHQVTSANGRWRDSPTRFDRHAALIRHAD